MGAGVARAVIALMKRRGIGVGRLARAMGLSPVELSAYLWGGRAWDTDQIAAAAGELGVLPVAVLLETADQLRHEVVAGPADQ